MALTIRNKDTVNNLIELQKKFNIKTATQVIDELIKIAKFKLPDTEHELKQTKNDLEFYKNNYHNLLELVNNKNEIENKIKIFREVNKYNYQPELLTKQK